MASAQAAAAVAAARQARVLLCEQPRVSNAHLAALLRGRALQRAHPGDAAQGGCWHFCRAGRAAGSTLAQPRNSDRMQVNFPTFISAEDTFISEKISPRKRKSIVTTDAPDQSPPTADRVLRCRCRGSSQHHRCVGLHGNTGRPTRCRDRGTPRRGQRVEETCVPKERRTSHKVSGCALSLSLSLTFCPLISLAASSTFWLAWSNFRGNFRKHKMNNTI